MTILLFLILVFGSRFFPNPAPEGVLLVGPAHQLRVVASVLVPLACALLACFAGGLVAGRLASDSPGLNGASGTALGFLGGFVWFVWSLVPWVFVRPSNPGEVFTRSDHVGTLVFLTAVFCAVLPLVALGGFFGGRLGGRPRRGVRGGITRNLAKLRGGRRRLPIRFSVVLGCKSIS